MKKIIYLIVFSILILSSSCKKYMDIIPDDVATLDYAFRDRTSAEQYLFTCYSFLPLFGSTNNDPGLMCGDDLWFHTDLNGYSQLGWDLAKDGNNVSNPLFNFWDGTNGATSSMWQGIRDCNIFLSKIGNVKGDLESSEKKRWIAEVKFLKAYYHFYLLRMYGPIPIVKKNLPVSASPGQVAVYRAPVDSVVNYIVELLDEATPDLPLSIINGVSEMGRITQPIALSIKAKVLVMAASPLFNGNKDYANLIDNRGIQLFNQTFEKSKWERAANACKAAIDTCLAAGINLYHFSNPALAISDSTKLVVTSSAVVTDKWNVGRIWGASFPSRTLELRSMPRLADAWKRAVYQMLVPTLKMDEMYYTNHGVPIDEDKTYDYTDRYNLATVPDEEKYYMQPGYVTAKLSLNREPRFYGSLGIDGGWWYGLGRLDDTKQWPENFKLGSVSGGQIGTERYTITGLYIKKLTNYLSTYSGTSFAAKQYDYPIFRLADLYLLYAEALNESLGKPNAEVYKYVDMIRERTGLDGVVESWSKYSKYPQKPLTQDGMREIIHRERNIELAFEGHRLWDIRRWKEAIKYFNQPIQGWNITGTDAAGFYQKLSYAHHQYTLRDVFWPIKQSDILQNKNLMQNPGW